jgi:hypothetical protein
MAKSGLGFLRPALKFKLKGARGPGGDSDPGGLRPSMDPEAVPGPPAGARPAPSSAAAVRVCRRLRLGVRR